MASIEIIQSSTSSTTTPTSTTQSLPSLAAPSFILSFIAGTAGGIAQTLVAQPFDIVKVRLQSSDLYSSTLNCAGRILKEDGPKAFYKGTAMPLVGIGACVSLQFAFLQSGKKHFIEENKNEGKLNPESLSLGQLYLAGAGAGIGNSVISGPVEHIRIRLQTQNSTSLINYKGPLDALTKIYKSDGFRGVYQGQVATLARESHGYGMYFLAYEFLVQNQMESSQISRKEIPMSSAVLYGALAGWAMWLTDYPLDVIKSRMQTDGLPSQGKARKYTSAFDCAKQLYNENGWKGFTRGLTPTLIRSPFVNGATFAVFEMTMRMIT